LNFAIVEIALQTHREKPRPLQGEVLAMVKVPPQERIEVGCRNPTFGRM
jgi:hypothetical protein